MKVKKIAKQMEEYKRLGNLIKDLDQALRDFDRTEVSPIERNLIQTTPFYIRTDPIDKIKPAVNLNSAISELVHDEIKEILLQHRVNLKKQQDKLEV